MDWVLENITHTLYFVSLGAIQAHKEKLQIVLKKMKICLNPHYLYTIHALNIYVSLCGIFIKNIHTFYNLASFVVFYFHLILLNVFSKMLYRSALRTMKIEHLLYIDL